MSPPRPVRVLSALLLALAAFAAAPGRAQVPVDLELVLAVDVSGSIDEDEARLQRNGYLSALIHDEVIQAIQSGPLGRIALAYVEWAGEHYQHTVVDWRLVEDPASAQTFAAALAGAPRRAERWTSISGALDYAVPMFERNAFEGTRKVIDVSGDGYNNSGRSVTMARDTAVAAGVTINGLPILNDRPTPGGWPAAADLDVYFKANVIGGPGAFIVPAHDFTAFAQAILTKLVLEIAGRQPDETPRFAVLRKPE
jgi:hypothetical protein